MHVNKVLNHNDVLMLKLAEMECALLEIECMHEKADRNHCDLHAQCAKMINELREEVELLKDKVQEEKTKRKELGEDCKAEIETKQEKWLKRKEEYEDEVKALEELIEEEFRMSVAQDQFG